MIHNLNMVKEQIDDLEKEVESVYNNLVLPNWDKEGGRYPQTLYGYMMRVFSFIDLLSAYWKGNENHQSERMLGFMNTYMRPVAEFNSVAIQTWRHKLMHTAQPRQLKDTRNSIKYKWLLHWYEHLPEEQHYTFRESNNCKILNLGLVYFIRDLKRSLESYKKELAVSADLQSRYEQFQKALGAYEFRDIKV